MQECDRRRRPPLLADPCLDWLPPHSTCAAQAGQRRLPVCPLLHPRPKRLTGSRATSRNSLAQRLVRGLSTDEIHTPRGIGGWPLGSALVPPEPWHSRRLCGSSPSGCRPSPPVASTVPCGRMPLRDAPRPGQRAPRSVRRTTARADHSNGRKPEALPRSWWLRHPLHLSPMPPPRRPTAGVGENPCHRRAAADQCLRGKAFPPPPACLAAARSRPCCCGAGRSSGRPGASQRVVSSAVHTLTRGSDHRNVGTQREALINSAQRLHVENMLGSGNRGLVASDGFVRRPAHVVQVRTMAKYSGLEQRVTETAFLIGDQRLVPPVAGIMGMPQAIVGSSHAVVELHEQAHPLATLAVRDRRP